VHQGEQRVGLGVGQLVQQVGGVVGVHGLEDVGRPLRGQVREQRALVGLGHLLEHVGEPLVVEAVDHLVLALLWELRQRGRDVDGPHRLEHGKQALRALPVGERESRDRAPRQHLHRLAPAEAVAADPHGEPTDHPVPRAGRLDRGVDDNGLLAALDEPDVRVEQLADQ
jgi:hypothetical protein